MREKSQTLCLRDGSGVIVPGRWQSQGRMQAAGTRPWLGAEPQEVRGMDALPFSEPPQHHPSVACGLATPSSSSNCV